MKTLTPSKYKAVVSDFDGTLVDSSLVVHPSIITIIKKLKARDLVFSIATGRHYFEVIEKVCKQLGIKKPVITHGGAQIIDPATNKIIWKQYIPPKISYKVASYLNKFNSSYTIEGNKYYFANDSPNSPQKIGLVQKDLSTVISTGVAKIIFRPNKKALNNAIEGLSHNFRNLHITKSRGINNNLIIDITSIKASKHLALLELSKILKIKPQQIIGAGDSYNDYPLLSACGYKVATQDAPKQLKEIADQIIPPASKQGILTLLKQLT